MALPINQKTAIAGAALSGLCIYLAVLQTVPLLAWVALVPLFRAVETRKDIAVNSNNGWSGFIDASGRIDTTGFLFAIHPNDKLTLAVRYPLIPVYICLLFACAIIPIIIINKKPSIL